ncbi:MAG TPA: hypothetical protein VIL86_16755 [Tepidisphaeraceae bacterium]|jgi:hypothetical protein
MFVPIKRKSVSIKRILAPIKRKPVPIKRMFVPIKRETIFLLIKIIFLRRKNGFDEALSPLPSPQIAPISARSAILPDGSGIDREGAKGAKRAGKTPRESARWRGGGMAKAKCGGRNADRPGSPT